MVNIEIQEEVWKMVNEQGMTVEEVAIIRGNIGLSEPKSKAIRA